MRDESAGSAGRPADASPLPPTPPVPTPEQRLLLEFGEELSRRIAPHARIAHVLLPEDDAVAVVQQGRGGGSILVAADRSVYFFGSALGISAALPEFRAGARTPVERFA
ncbi:hypothetical protein OG782_24135 [Streptomyces sp. NBC_00876]|uniref:hypothetical protein n=1 Tax=Streptomyces sp. NBC_00876 TaxID=2975853 RepID=UPI00386582A3|nr:hypothetical protein OG782_24135 [Streptomyces sp. NBC_00876]